jgi:HD-GYP domain-containing protein (c-di-GMP phosphodiesterase class II)
MGLELDLRQTIFALTDALDLVGVDEVGHGKRVGFMALDCGRLLGLGREDRDLLFHAALLHDCGVSSTVAHRHLVEEMDWDEADVHCRVGEERLSRFAPLAPLGVVVRYHHTHWDRLRALGLPPQVERFANLIFLVDRVDAKAAPHYGSDLLLAREGVRDEIAALAGTFFAPELVEVFLTASTSEAFWISLESPHLERFLFDMERDHVPLPLDSAQLKDLGLLFAGIVDAKSRFTHEHSLGVAGLARHLAERNALPPATCDKVELAGLLHDLGKLRIPDEILDKPGALDPAERSVMLRHSFESYQVLRRIRGLGDIALWAAYHHEAPNGRGYPFHVSSGGLSLEARIIAVADVFQALAQERPYRPPMALDDILSMLRRFVAENRLDPGLVAMVEQDPVLCLAYARSTRADYRESRALGDPCPPPP